MHYVLTLGLPTFILLSGLIDDLRSRKIHNELIVGLALFTITFIIFVYGMAGVQQSVLGGGMAVVLCLPLFLGKILGGGDLKLFTVFGLATDWNIVLWVLIYSFFWGAALGLTRAILAGRSRELLTNTLKLAIIFSSQSRSDLRFQKIPYSVALFFGWMTHISLVWG